MVRSNVNWPEWWSWELDCSNPHLAKRMLDRQFNETDLRDMLQRATAYRPDASPGRWVIRSSRNKISWEIIAEPNIIAKFLIVVTAFPIG
jgi:hypothetical protein